MRVLQVGESLAVEYGGTAAACAELTNQLARCGVDVSVITLGGANGSGPTWPLDPAVAAAICMPAAPRRLGYCPGMRELFESLAPQNVVHVHGLWRLHYLQSAHFARAHDIPLIVSIHGMLLDAALRQRASLKRIERWLFQDALLRRARCLHATSSDEADGIRRLGFREPVAVVPWGVHPPDASSSRFPSFGSDTAPDRMMLYLGRLHPSKGLEPLLRAWAQVCEQFGAWRLVVAGYDEGGYRSTLMALASELGIAETISFAGPVHGPARERLFGDASLVVMPSPAENFGFVVPEALVRGVPVIATQGSPWSTLVTEACGWWVPPGASSLAAALVEALGQSPKTLHDMGEHGRRLARERYTWDRVANSMMELYEWTLGRRDEPAFVQR